MALATNATLIRAIGRPLRRFAPILSVAGIVVVTRYDDVREVLERDEDFTIAEINSAPMDRINGPFILSMDRSTHYSRERSILQSCVQPQDPARIRSTVRAVTAELLARRPRGRLDVVQDLARPAALRLAGDYFGLPGPDPVTMMRWTRALFREAFLNSGGDRDARRAALHAAAEFHAYADELIARRLAMLSTGTPAPDDFLTRLIRLRDDPRTRLSPEGIRRTLGGVVVGAIEPTSKVTAQAVERLLRHGCALRRARDAALDGDTDLVRRYALEAQRFNPLTAAVVRHTARDTVLAAGTPRQRRIPAGRKVYAALLPAMFDPAAFPDPGSLRGDRPASRYLSDGHGLHRCFGRYVNDVQVTELIAALLRLDGLRPAPGRPGRIRYDGPFPDRLLVEFGQGRAA
ncbi:cytochrome P450 [Actinoplanes regularis]|uniref:Cytochrome P450 n=1 Tax=Actinoplanes regularis TaxID=52697 RepID=A0A238YVW1_9ACTN|nr:cytochrome P450 [Actinoplanes regularis]GIE85614.1 cytochrome P450 [Actinoplanes regularis]SNR75426.1 Cytochrome P450 [Actinoplanes regularis]